MNRTLVVALAAAALGLLFGASAYRLPEWEQAVIIQLGKPVREPVKKAGLHFRIPFIEAIHRLDRRILNWDGEANRIPTKDKKYIWVDTTARWRIQDPLLFIQSVRDETGADPRIKAIIDSSTRDVISNHNLVEAVRNSNAILDSIEERHKLAAEGKLPPEEEEVTGEIENIAVGREELSRQMIESSRAKLAELGIELIDIQIRRIAYETSVEQKVYERMVSERRRIAQKIRSIGTAEQSKIRGKIKKDLETIQSEAYRKAETLKGQADAEAIRIYAGAMNADPGFYEFLRTLEAYKKALPKDSKLILSTDSAFFELLRRGKGSAPAAAPAPAPSN